MRRGWWKVALTLFLFLAPFSRAALLVRPNVIYGGDDRAEYYEITEPAWRARADSTVALVRAANLQDLGDVTRIVSVPLGPTLGLCPSERFYGQGRVAACSGFLVAPDTVVTAGHCISQQSACDQTRFVFGYRLEDPASEPTTVPSAHVFACKSIVHTVTMLYGEDFAVVKLDRPVTHVSPLAFRRQGHPELGDALTLMGYPGGIPLKIASGGQVRRLMPEFMVTNVDSYAMNSGSAVFNSITGEVEGILVRGERDYELQDGCLVSKRCDPTGCRGEDVTLFERVLPYLSP